MPSLKNLHTFADLLRNIGDEESLLNERGLEPDTPDLPKSEPEPLSPSGTPNDEPSANEAAGDEPGADTAADREPPETGAAQTPPETVPDDIDLEDLLGGLIPDGVIPEKTAPDTDAEPAPRRDTAPPSDDEGAGVAPLFDFGDFAHPVDEDLSPLTIDHALPEGFNEDETPAEPDFSPDNFNLDGLDFPFEDSAVEPEPAAETQPAAEPDLSVEPNTAAEPEPPVESEPAVDTDDAANAFDETIPDLGGIGDILDPIGRADTERLPSSDEGFQDILGQDTDIGEAAGSGQPEQIDDFDDVLDAVIGESSMTDNLAASGKTDDPFDRFDLADSEEGPVQESEASSEFPGLDNFVIPGIDMLSDSESAPDSPVAQTGPEEAAAKKTEEVNLTEEEFAQLQETLQDYPLNLRIACEEIIVGDDADPSQTAKLIKLLVRGGAARDAAKLAGKISGKEITVPRGYQKQTGIELEEEQASFAYIFAKKFLPTLGLILFIAGAIAGTAYLGWNFIYKPWKADSLYKIGIERIAAGEYERANERFNEAWRWKPVKDWFYTYAETFRDARQYFYAEEKYEQLIAYTASRNKKGIPEKKGVLDYALMETDYLRDYEKADRILRRHILDWNPDDSEGLLALGDVNLAWGDANVEFSNEGDRNRDGGKYDVARENYARALELYGWIDSILERMLLYFIRADDLAEILPLQDYFMSQKTLKIRPATLSEMGAYLLGKQIEETRYVRDANIDKIEGVRDILLRAAEADPFLPDPHYQLARYYAMLGERNREREYLDNASRLFDNTRHESAKLIRDRIDTEQRIARLNRDRREFFSAEERLLKAANLYEDAVGRRIFRQTSRFGSIYADLGDLEYFTKFSDDSLPGDWQEAVTYYLRAEETGYSTTEMQYRLGASYYHLSDFRRAEERFFEVSTRMPPNRRVLNALGNVSFLRGNISAAESYFSKLVSILQSERLRITEFQVDSVPEHRELSERLMIAQNNLGAVYQTLAERNGSNRYRTRALALYSDASRIWDYFARNPSDFVRPGLADFSLPTIGLPYLNTGNVLYPASGTSAEIFIDIDRDMQEPSPWEHLLSND
jgi:tetratricopeptide (TPR) repeat protein